MAVNWKFKNKIEGWHAWELESVLPRHLYIVRLKEDVTEHDLGPILSGELVLVQSHGLAWLGDTHGLVQKDSIIATVETS